MSTMVGIESIRCSPTTLALERLHLCVARKFDARYVSAPTCSWRRGKPLRLLRGWRTSLAPLLERLKRGLAVRRRRIFEERFALETSMHRKVLRRPAEEPPNQGRVC